MINFCCTFTQRLKTCYYSYLHACQPTLSFSIGHILALSITNYWFIQLTFPFFQHGNKTFFLFLVFWFCYVSTFHLMNWSLLTSSVTKGRGHVAQCPPETSDREISADLPGKKRQGQNGKQSRKEGKLKREGGKFWKWKEEKLGNEERTPFFFFFFFLLFHFKNHWNLFWVYQNQNFLPGKKHFMLGKMTLPPLKIISLVPLLLI